MSWTSAYANYLIKNFRRDGGCALWLRCACSVIPLALGIGQPTVQGKQATRTIPSCCKLTSPHSHFASYNRVIVIPLGALALFIIMTIPRRFTASSFQSPRVLVHLDSITATPLIRPNDTADDLTHVYLRWSRCILQYIHTYRGMNLEHMFTSLILMTLCATAFSCILRFRVSPIASATSSSTHALSLT